MGPLPNGRTSWLINGGDPNHLLTGMILQAPYLKSQKTPGFTSSEGKKKATNIADLHFKVAFDVEDRYDDISLGPGGPLKKGSFHKKVKQQFPGDCSVDFQGLRGENQKKLC